MNGLHVKHLHKGHSKVFIVLLSSARKIPNINQLHTAEPSSSTQIFNMLWNSKVLYHDHNLQLAYILRQKKSFDILLLKHKNHQHLPFTIF
jgi:hypothetical protein